MNRVALFSFSFFSTLCNSLELALSGSPAVLRVQVHCGIGHGEGLEIVGLGESVLLPSSSSLYRELYQTVPAGDRWALGGVCLKISPLQEAGGGVIAWACSFC